MPELRRLERLSLGLSRLGEISRADLIHSSISLDTIRLATNVLFQTVRAFLGSDLWQT